MSIKQFVKDWTLPVAIAVGTIVYLTFYFVPQLDAAGETLGAVVDTIFPMMVFCTLFSTFCRIDFHQMKPHRWHVGVLLAQVLLVALNVWIIFCVEASFEQKILWESVLTCIIGPAATAAPVVTAKIGGNINTMTAFVVLSSFASALMIPAVFPLLERGSHLSFWSAFLIILQKLAMVRLRRWLSAGICSTLPSVSVPGLCPFPTSRSISGLCSSVSPRESPCVTSCIAMPDCPCCS